MCSISTSPFVSWSHFHPNNFCPSLAVLKASLGTSQSPVPFLCRAGGSNWGSWDQMGCSTFPVLGALIPAHIALRWLLRGLPALWPPCAVPQLSRFYLCPYALSSLFLFLFSFSLFVFPFSFSFFFPFSFAILQWQKFTNSLLRLSSTFQWGHLWWKAVNRNKTARIKIKWRKWPLKTKRYTKAYGIEKEFINCYLSWTGTYISILILVRIIKQRLLDCP